MVQHDGKATYILEVIKQMKIFIAGCSFSAENGFFKENLRYTWPNVLAKELSARLVNVAHSGQPNLEIFNKTVEAITNDQTYDLAIIQWSGFDRRWVYPAENNIDQPISITPGMVFGAESTNIQASDLETYSKFHYTYLNNMYINFKNWMMQILSLHSFLLQKKIPYIFLKGFENLISDVQKINLSIDLESGIPCSIKAMINFKNNSDEQILKKINEITFLLAEVKKTTTWVNLESEAFNEFTKFDCADDGKHPGIIACQKFVDLIKEKYENIG